MLSLLLLPPTGTSVSGAAKINYFNRSVTASLYSCTPAKQLSVTHFQNPVVCICVYLQINNKEKRHGARIYLDIISARVEPLPLLFL